ncbi:MAG: hypothetical protein ACXWUM_04590 [Burkholderiaceae bacterium]
MTRLVTVALLLAMGAVVTPEALAAAEAGATHGKPVQFAKGKSSAQVRGSIKGERDAAYTVNARAGQTLAVSLTSANGSLNFNINAPGSNESMFIGSVQGAKASVVLPADGSYVVQVYLMRNAARRNESASYTLDVAVTGQPLPPLPVSQDALVPGTRFHATAAVPCQTLGSEASATCNAFVTRRGRDGSATVELRGPNGLGRNVLFVKGQPVASDSAQPMTSSRQGDLTTVRLGSDERYDVPDALLTGG